MLQKLLRVALHMVFHIVSLSYQISLHDFILVTKVQ